MSALLDPYRIAGWYLLIVALLPALAVAAWMGEALDLERQRTRQARRDACNESARARAAEHPHRTRLHTGHRVIDQTVTGRAPLPDADMDAWLAQWEAKVEDKPFTHCNGALALFNLDGTLDLSGFAPTMRPSTARMRRLAA